MKGCLQRASLCCVDTLVIYCSGESGDWRSELPWAFRRDTEDKCLARDVALANVEIFISDAAGHDVVRGPVEAAAVDADAQVGLDVVRGDAPVLRELRQAVLPVTRRGRGGRIV